MKLIRGDCLNQLKILLPETIDCVVTSPPYFGLRDYGNKDQIGLEITPEEYVEKLVFVFREVKRILKDTGTVWINLGDTYNARRNGGHPGGGRTREEGKKLHAKKIGCERIKS